VRSPQSTWNWIGICGVGKTEENERKKQTIVCVCVSSESAVAAATLLRTSHATCPRFPVPALPAVPSPFPTCPSALPCSSWGGLVSFCLHSSKRLSVHGWAESLQQPIWLPLCHPLISICVRSVRVRLCCRRWVSFVRSPHPLRRRPLSMLSLNVTRS